MQVTIRSSSGYEIKLNKEHLVTLFPGSMLAATLDLDPSTEVIGLAVSTVTADVLDVLSDLVNTGQVPTDLSRAKTQLSSAGRYLLIDLLEVLGDPKYEHYHQAYPDVDLLGPSDRLIPSLQYAIRAQYISLFQYLYPYVECEYARYIVLTLSVMLNQEDLVRYILMHKPLNLLKVPLYHEDFFNEHNLHLGVDRRDIQFNSAIYILYYALGSTRSIVERLLGSIMQQLDGTPRMDHHIMTGLNMLLIHAEEESPQVINAILSHPQFEYRLSGWAHKWIGLAEYDALRAVMSKESMRSSFISDIKNNVEWIMFKLMVCDTTSLEGDANLRKYTETMDRFYENYEDSHRKAMYLVDLIPEMKRIYDVYHGISRGEYKNLDSKSSQCAQFLLAGIASGNIRVVKDLLQVYEPGGLYQINQVALFAVYFGRLDMINVVIARIKETRYPYGSDWLTGTLDMASRLARLKYPGLTLTF